MKNKKRFFSLLPGILLVVVFPVFSRLQMVDTGLSGYPWFTDAAEQGDFFLYWKAVLFCVLAAGMAVILIVERKKYRNDKIWILLSIYVLAAVLSLLCSKHRELSVKGMFGSYQTIWVLIGYVITAFYFCCISREGENHEILLGALCVGAGIQGILGISQLLKHDFWGSVLGRWFLSASGENLIFRFQDSAQNRVYMASYHPNYAAVYCILVLPILLACFWKCEKKSQKCMLAVLCAVLTVCLYGTGSRAGILTFLGLGVLAALFLTKGRKGRGACLGMIVCLGVLITFAYPLLTGQDFLKYLKKGLFPERTSYPLKEIQVNEEGITISYKNKKVLLNLSLNEEGKVLFDVKDEQGRAVDLNRDEDTGYYWADDLETLKYDIFIEDGELYLLMYHEGIPWHFSKPLEGGNFSYKTLYGKKDVIVPAPFVGFEGRERLMSNRGYIWSRTIPMLKKAVILGMGPDTFALNFPQNDYVMRANLGKDMLIQAVTRPHSLYLQMIVETGLVSAIAFIVFVAVILYRLKKYGEDRFLSKGIFFAIMGYLIMGIANDMSIVVTPLFFALMGMGANYAEFKKRRSGVRH